MKYLYVKGNPLESKIDYSYSKYRGIEFINEWQESRETCLKDLAVFGDFSILENLKSFDNQSSSTERLFNDWLQKPELLLADLEKIYLLIKRFEVVRKLFNSYDENFRPYDKTDFLNYNLYIKFGFVLNYLFKESNKMQYLNSLLKVNDILIGTYFHNSNVIANKGGLSAVIKLEIKSVDLTMNRLNIK